MFVIEAAEYTVLYSDNSAEVIFSDVDLANKMSYIYRGDITPLYVDEEKSQRGFGPVRYMLPEVKLVASGGQHLVLTIKNGERPGYLCDSDIFYIDRTTQTSRVIETDLCIGKMLDKSVTRFWTMNSVTYPETTKPYFVVGVGEYATGEVIASAKVPAFIKRDVETDYIGDLSLIHI